MKPCVTALLTLLLACALCACGPAASAQTPGWVRIGQPCTSNQAFVRDFVLVSDTDIWVVCRVDGIQHSPDGGLTWTSENAGLGGIITNIANIVNSPFGLYITLTGTVNSNQGAYRFVNGKWVKLTTLPPTPGNSPGRPIIDIVYHAETNEMIAIANNGNMSAYASADGVKFALVKNTIHTGIDLAFWQDSQGMLWEGTEAAGNMLSADAGRTWTNAGPLVNGIAYGEAPNGTILYSERANVYRRTGPARWALTTGIYYNDTITAFARDTTRVYAATWNAQTPLYESSDNGATWTPYLKDGSEPPVGIRLQSMQMSAQGQLYVGANDGWIYRVGTSDPPSPDPPDPTGPSDRTGPSSDGQIVARTPNPIADTVEVLASGLATPASLAPTPDGRVFVAFRDHIVVVNHGRVLAQPALVLGGGAAPGEVGVPDMALHPHFGDEHLVYIAQTIVDANGSLVTRLSRYRELNGVFGERVVLRELSLGPTGGRARIRIGSDEKLYVGIADRSDSNTSLSAYEGSILRLDLSGSTPRDNPRGSPIVSAEHGNLQGMDWERSRGLWVVEDNRLFRSLEQTVTLVVSRGQNQNTSAFSIDGGPTADMSGITFWTDDAGERTYLFGANRAGDVNYVRIPLGGPPVEAKFEQLFTHQFGSITDIVAGSDGWIYFSSVDHVSAGGGMHGSIFRFFAPAVLSLAAGAHK